MTRSLGRNTLLLTATCLLAQSAIANLSAQQESHSAFVINSSSEADARGASPAVAAFTNPNQNASLQVQTLSPEQIGPRPLAAPTLKGGKALGTYSVDDGRGMFDKPPIVVEPSPALKPLGPQEKVASGSPFLTSNKSNSLIAPPAANLPTPKLAPPAFTPPAVQTAAFNKPLAPPDQQNFPPIQKDPRVAPATFQQAQPDSPPRSFSVPSSGASRFGSAASPPPQKKNAPPTQNPFGASSAPTQPRFGAGIGSSGIGSSGIGSSGIGSSNPTPDNQSGNSLRNRNRNQLQPRQADSAPRVARNPPVQQPSAPPRRTTPPRTTPPRTTPPRTTPPRSTAPRTTPPRTTPPRSGPRSTATNPPANRQPKQNNSPQSSSAAKQLLAKWSPTQNSKTKLAGQPLSLAELLTQPLSTSRHAAINQYWETWYDLANHMIAVESANWLAATRARDAAEQNLLKAAQQAAQNNVLATEIQLGKSQLKLQQMLPSLRGRDGKPILVIPSDTPWVGKIKTNFQKYSQRGMVPQRFNQIDQILPKAHRLILNRADAANASDKTAEMAKQAAAQSRAPVSNVLEASRICTMNKRQLVSSVVGYNRAITDYILSVRQDIVQPQRLSSVLIGKKATLAAMQRSRTANQTAVTGSESISPVGFNRPATGQTAFGQTAFGQTPPEPDPSNNEPATSSKSAYQTPSFQASGGGAPSSASSRQTNNSFDKSPKSPATRPAGSLPTNRKKSWDYGPTPETAAASNFDPDNLTTESAVAKVQSAPPSSTYEGGPQTGQAVRSARSPGAPGTGTQRPPRTNPSLNRRNPGPPVQPRGPAVDSGNSYTQPRKPVGAPVTSPLPRGGGSGNFPSGNFPSGNSSATPVRSGGPPPSRANNGFSIPSPRKAAPNPFGTAGQPRKPAPPTNSNSFKPN